MNSDSMAPGKPGISPTWCSSRKDMVVTSLGTSRTWVTIGHGILNEVYWPSTGRPQIRDLGFIVAKDDKWCEVKRMNRYDVSIPKPYILIPTLKHTGDDFSLTLDVVCDDLRDVVLVQYNLQGDGYRLYALLAPRLGSQGHNNSIYCNAENIFGRGDDAALCLRASRGFTRSSAGYVGESDGYSDFKQHRRMTWEYPSAEEGNVAAMAELAETQGVLSLGFGSSWAGAETSARASLADGFDNIFRRAQAGWETWGADWDPPRELSNDMRAQVQHCTAVLKTCEDREFPGAVVASLSVPWGNTRDDLGGYHLVWPRDSAESALGMLAVNHFGEARKIAAYLIATQQPNGCWMQNFYPNGQTYGDGIQLDQVSFPLLLVAKLNELGELGDLEGVETMIRRALGFLLSAGPVTPQDRWEENEGISVFTLSLMVAAMVGAADFITDNGERNYLLSYADYLNQRIEDWVYVTDTDLAAKYGVHGYFLRLAKPSIFSGDYGEINIKGKTLPATDVVAVDYMYLSRMGLRRPTDPRMKDTLKVVEGELRVETPSGPGFYRYTDDAYGEHEDGRPFDGKGRGRLWPLLTGERGHLAVQLGEDAAIYLQTMIKMSGTGRLLPEQVWDTDAIPERHLFPGQPTGSAKPLLWAHAEFVKLATASITKQPIELLKAVKQRYGFERPEAKAWHWRTAAPFGALPADTELLVEAPEPFKLHFGLGDWQEIQELPSEPMGFGMHGVRLQADQWQDVEEIKLTFYYEDRDEWENRDYSIKVVSTPQTSAKLSI